MKKAISILLTIAGVIMIAIGAIPKIVTHVTNISKVEQSISVIGGADGPTAIFIAGKIGPDFGWVSMIVGIVILVVGLIMMFRRQKF